MLPGLCLPPLGGAQGGIDPYLANVVLLLGFEGANGATSTTDESPSPKVMTFVGDAKIDTTQNKFGVSSLRLDGSGDYLATPDHVSWDFGAGQFTAESWVRFNVLPASGQDMIIAAQWGTAASSAAWEFGYQNSATGLFFLCYDTGNVLRTAVAAWTPSAGVWYHVAIARDASGVVRFFVNGTQVGSDTAFAYNIADKLPQLWVGARNHTSPAYLNGWLDELRITKGVGRYTANFTAPASAFPRG